MWRVLSQFSEGKCKMQQPTLTRAHVLLTVWLLRTFGALLCLHPHPSTFHTQAQEGNVLGS